MAIEGPRAVLPPPERRFKGTIGTWYSDSVADVPALPSAPAAHGPIAMGLQ
jgi:hypothetical protein